MTVTTAHTTAASNSIGQPVPRKEDRRLLTGQGRFSDDVDMPAQAHAFMLRSPHAHARIGKVDTARAKAAPGVLAVLTGADALADGLGPMPRDHMAKAPPGAPPYPEPPLVNRDGGAIPDTILSVLPHDVVRFAGQAVAMIVAETLSAAKDAAELIEIDYAPLPVVIGTAEAAAVGAPRIYPDLASNICMDCELGDAAGTTAALAQAAHVVRLDTLVHRVTGVPMEARSCVGRFEAEGSRYILHAGSGGIVRQKREIADILRVPFDSVRITADDIGGNFGTRNSLFCEFPLCLWAAKKIGRPVKWTAERSEAFLSDHQGRDMVCEAEMGLDREGRIIALRVSNLSNIGAFTSSMVPLRKSLCIINGLYRVPVGHARGRAVLSNTPPTIPYRSAGRPEAMFFIERLMDLAAVELGIDRIEIRRRNMIKPHELPYRNPVGITYDNGAYERAMDQALRLSAWDQFPQRKAEARARGKLRGIGIGNYIEITMGMPRERGEVIILPDGIVEVLVGTLSSGQGHETSYAQCVADWLGVPFDAIRLIEGDTDRIPVGGGSHSGRSMRMAGFVMSRAADGVIAKARRIAAHLLEAPVDAIDFAGGLCTVRGTNRSLSLFEVAEAARNRADLPDDMKGPLSAAHDEHFQHAGFPYGTAICEIEIDPETGALEIVRYASVDDVGRAINPLILHGQTHGGIAQGVGQALWERCHYDPETGQLLSASFMDYCMPRADMLPMFDTGLSEVPAPHNPLGVRAGGEGGTTPALAAVMSAVVDALAEYGVTHMEMPATPERIWRAIRRAD